MKRPAIRIVLAPLQRYKNRGEGFLHGMTEGRTIYLDPRSEEILSTLRHELLHIEHPSWNEDEILVEERKWWKRATWREKAELLKWLAHARIEEGRCE